MAVSRLCAVGALLTLGLATSCLDLGGSTAEPPTSDGGGGKGDSSIVGDASFPDAAGGTSSDASVGGSGGSGGSGGTGGIGGSSGTGATGGSGGGTGGLPGSTLYTYNVNAGTWSSVPLASAWNGTNAPPSSGIVAVTQLEHFDRLLVFTASTFYLRANGIWQPPVLTTQKFPALTGLTLRSVFHVASPPGMPLDEGITFVSNPVAISYSYHSNDAVVYVDQITMNDEPSPGAPQYSGTQVFDFEIRDPAKYGAADYYLFYLYYTDGKLYQFDAAFNWLSWPASQSPFWNGKPGAPNPSSIVAAWFDQGYQRVELIGP